MEGYIKLHRGILESSIFASQIGLKIWIWILLKANYTEKFVPIKIGKGESILKVERGSFVFGRFKAEEELNIDGSTVYKWLKKLESEQMITINSNSHYSIVTVCKYDSYQTVDIDKVATTKQPRNNHVTAIEQPRNTTNKEKNTEEEKEYYKDAAKAATQKRVEDFKKSLYPFVGKYDKETVKHFFDYWSELNKTQTKMLWELKPTFEISKRLATWERNNNKFTNEKSEQQTNHIYE